MVHVVVVGFFYICFDNLSEKRFILLWLVFMQQFGLCCGCHRSYWLLFDHLPEKWFMLRFVILTICQRSDSCCGGYLWPVAREVVHVVVVIFDHLPEKRFMLRFVILTICQRSGSCCSGYFLPFAREVVHVLVVVFILLLTICRKNYSFIVVD